MNGLPATGALWLALFSSVASGGEAVRTDAVASFAPGGAMLAQLTLGLVAVLALAVGLSWLLRRYALPRDGLIRVVGGLPLSGRERLLLIEVDRTRLLLGVTATRIQTLHVFGPETAPPADAPAFRLDLPPSESPHDAKP
ncbi:MAG: flagellar biosynthetic protein FliO [Candidatus Competibacteraceae bacterium]|nr:flagellar biosynthetic protein FliO [Candidatus Competibacteraceae bacterium]